MTTGSEILALGYAGDERAASLTETVLAEIDGWTTPYAAYVWYCPAEADPTLAPERAPPRFARALERAEAPGASLVTGLPGASMASLVARPRDPAAPVQEYRGDRKRVVEGRGGDGRGSTAGHRKL